jgi:predicted PurR-regulated permease PerM
MRTTIIRLLLFLLLWALFYFVIRIKDVECTQLLLALIITYILSPVLIEKIKM